MPGSKNNEWASRTHRRVNMVLRSMPSTQVGLVINPVTGSISPQYHVVFDDNFSAVAISIDAYEEVCIASVLQRKLRINVMLYQ